MHGASGRPPATGDEPDGARPLLMVDIDGVISLFGVPAAGRPGRRYPARGACTRSTAYSHFLSATAAAHLLELAELFDLVWASGWEERAEEHLPTAARAARRAAVPALRARAPGNSDAHWKLEAIDALRRRAAAGLGRRLPSTTPASGGPARASEPDAAGGDRAPARAHRARDGGAAGVGDRRSAGRERRSRAETAAGVAPLRLPAPPRAPVAPAGPRALPRPPPRRARRRRTGPAAAAGGPGAGLRRSAHSPSVPVSDLRQGVSHDDFVRGGGPSVTGP